MYQQDVFIEQTVERRANTGARVLTYVALGITILSVILIPFTYLATFLPAVLFGILTWWEFQNLRIDFDYTYTNGILDIARVRAQSKRKTLVSIDMEDVLVMAPTHTDPVMPYVGNGMKTFDAISHTPDTKYYVLIATDRSKNQDIKILWEPNEEMLDALRRRDPYKIHLN